MKAVPRFLTGPFRNALNIALAEATMGNRVQDLARQVRGWKLFLLLPRCTTVPGVVWSVVTSCSSGFAKFARGEWLKLLQESEECDERAATARHRQRHNRQHDLERRSNRALQLVQIGEFSSARVALEGAEIALGNDDTLRSLEDPYPHDDLLLHVIPFLRIWSGQLGGASGMTYEHFRPLLDNSRDMLKCRSRLWTLWEWGGSLFWGNLTGGVRGIVAGDLFRRLVSRTIAK